MTVAESDESVHIYGGLDLDDSAVTVAESDESAQFMKDLTRVIQR